MTATTSRLDTPAALIYAATDVARRVHRLAARLRPMYVLRLQGELALVARVLDEVEDVEAGNRQFDSESGLKPRALRGSSPEFIGGRLALPAPKRRKTGRGNV